MAATWTLLDAVSVRSVQAATEAAPSSSTDGLLLDNVIGVSFWLDAGAGQTITADVGQVDVYGYDAGLWGTAPLLVLQVPPGASGHRRVQLGTVRIDNSRGRIAPICNGVSVSGATAIVDALATLDRRGISKAV